MPFPTATITDERVLSWVNSATGYQNFRKLVADLASPIGELIDVLDQIKGSFVLGTAVGDPLDKIGSMVGMARSGQADPDYLISLNIQIEILASQLRTVSAGEDGNWTGTINNILKIVDMFGGGLADYAPVYPYGFKLNIPNVLTPIQIQDLFQLIRRALYAGVLGYTIFLLGPNNLWANAIDIGGGVGQWVPGDVIGEALWADAVPIIEVWQVSAAAVFIDQTPAFLDPGLADFFPLPGISAIGDYCAYGAKDPFAQLILNNAGGTAGLAGVVDWEYWDGAAWQLLPGIVDGTLSYGEVPADGQVVSWLTPVDWAPTTQNGGANLYYVRSITTVLYAGAPEYDDGSFPEPQPGEWVPGLIPFEGEWNTVFSTASTTVLSNDNT